MKKVIIGIGCLVGIGCIMVVLMFDKCHKASEALVFQDIDLQQIADGTYTGSCDLTLVKVFLSVTIEAHTIVDIQLLEHDNGMGVEAEKLLDQMIETQQIDIDVISGATISSNAIHKAMENALTKK